VNGEIAAGIGTRILGPDGPIASSLPGYEPREAQIEIADIIGDCLKNGRHALLEAGTGTGKSLAYLIPAIELGERVVVSTDTIALQEQLVKKDLPFLEKALGKPIEYAVAKGKSNFLCPRNLIEGVHQNTIAPNNSLQAQEVVNALDAFKSGEWNGDKSDLRGNLWDGTWADICADDTCEGSSCKHAKTCPYMLAKEKLESAQIIITNHTMYLLSCYVKQKTGGMVSIIPDAVNLVADEAHTFPDKIQDVFGVDLKQRRPLAILQRIKKQAKNLSIDIEFDSEEIGRRSQAFFSKFWGAVKEQQLLIDFPEEVLVEAVAARDNLIAAFGPIRLEINRELSMISQTDFERRRAVGSLADAINSLREDLLEILPFHRVEDPDEGPPGSEFCWDPDQVYYCEISEDNFRNKFTTLSRKPAEAAGVLREVIYPSLNSAIMISATMTAGKGESGWKPTISEFGMEGCDPALAQVESPFDYPSQVIGYYPKGVLPEPRDPQYHAKLANILGDIIKQNNGHTFVLFTSNRDLKEVSRLLGFIVPHRLFIQGTGSKDELVRGFRESPNSVLLGVKTFWTGVDIPGETLSCVVIPKLPFPQPDHPLVKARCERIKARGGSDFIEYSLPRCIRDFKQGFGRLIRTGTDIGQFACLDPRLATAKYGKTIRNALPTFRWSTEIDAKPTQADQP
jgi:ATP-dependent DNA helicase DinG